MSEAQFPTKVAFSRHRIFRWLIFEWMTKQLRLPISRNVNFQDYKLRSTRGLEQFLFLCLFTPNYTRNHVITYT